jgi:LmbE family N-acetylglucosaminyl deacetylase
VSGGIAAILAHPDDEAFAVGGTIARHSAAGVPCHLYCATDGDAGRASGVAVGSRGELGRRRRAELRKAAEILGFEAVWFGAHPDGALAGVDQDGLIGEIVRVLRSWRPSVVLTFGPEGAPNAHRDHRAISRAATAAFFAARIATMYPDQIAAGLDPHAPDRLYYVAWPDPPPDAELPSRSLPIDIRVDIRAFATTKRRSFMAHETQLDHRARFERLGMTAEEGFHLAAGARGASDNLLG